VSGEGATETTDNGYPKKRQWLEARTPRRECNRVILVIVIVSASLCDTTPPLVIASLPTTRTAATASNVTAKERRAGVTRVLRPHHRSSSSMSSSDCDSQLDLLAGIAALFELSEAAASQSSLACSITPDVDDVNPLPLQPPVITEEMLSKVTPNDVNVITQMLKLANKHHALAEFPPIRLRNVKKCLTAPLHLLGGYRSWDWAVAAISLELHAVQTLPARPPPGLDYQESLPNSFEHWLAANDARSLGGE